MRPTLWLLAARTEENDNIVRYLKNCGFRTGQALVDVGQGELKKPVGWDTANISHAEVEGSTNPLEFYARRERRIMIIGWDQEFDFGNVETLSDKEEISVELSWVTSITKRALDLADIIPQKSNLFDAAATYLSAAYNGGLSCVDPEELMHYRVANMARDWQDSIGRDRMNSKQKKLIVGAMSCTGEGRRTISHWYEAAVGLLRNCRQQIEDAEAIELPSGPVKDMRSLPFFFPGMAEVSHITNIPTIIRKNNSLSLHGAGEGSSAGAQIVEDTAIWAEEAGYSVVLKNAKRGNLVFKEKR